jgi:hypothetical protein
VLDSKFRPQANALVTQFMCRKNNSVFFYCDDKAALCTLDVGGSARAAKGTAAVA